MVEYLFKFFIISLISYLGGRFLINYSFNYKVNRLWLLFCLFFSILIPLVNFEISTGNIISSINLEENLVNDNLNVISKPFKNASKNSMSIFSVIGIVYVLITLVLLYRFNSNIRTLLKKRKNANQVNYHGTKIYILDEDIKPFTFLQNIFISKSDWLNHKNKAELIHHEIYHRNLNHSLDILLIEFVKVIFWFNPVLYFYKILIQSNHEYEVDNAIISNGFDAKSYTHIIIDYTFKPKTKHYSLSSGFSLSLIKNRIHMISKFKKNRTSFKQSLLMLCLTTLMFLSTAFTLDTSGYFLADSISYSQKEHKLYLQGESIEVNFQGDDISGKGTFSFLGKIDFLKINGRMITSDATIKVIGKKCVINQIIDENELSKLGLDNKAKAFEIIFSEK